jgi:hypothetical protein
MRKKSKTGNKARSWEATYDLPPELDFSKLRVVGVGLQALQKHAASKRKLVELEPDVAEAFPTSGAVNEGLRKLQQIERIVQPIKRKKTA